MSNKPKASERARSSNSSQTINGSLISGASVLAFFICWEVLAVTGGINPVLISSPSRVISAGIYLLSEGALNDDIAFTLKVFTLSVTIAVIVGVGLGFAIGTNKTAYYLLNPFITVANSLPKIVLMPLIMLWLGLTMSANVFLGALMASFPIIISVYTGVRSLDRDFIELAEVYDASPWFVFRMIILPGITPFVLSGMRVAISYAMVGCLIAEFFASSEGIGYRMVLYMSNFEVDAFFVCMVLVAGFTLSIASLVHRLERRIEAWRPAAFRSMEMP